MHSLSPDKLHNLTNKINFWAKEMGFQAVGISDTDLSQAEKHLHQWLKKNYHGSMDYMQKHGNKRSRPALLHNNTIRIISLRMDYFPQESNDPFDLLNSSNLAYISRYALGRDYHKVLRSRLKKLVAKIELETGSIDSRIFVDSAPVLEKAIAEKAGLGWIGKHSNLLSRDAGSWFFLGEIYIDLPLPISTPSQSHCGDCSACIDECPTQAIVAPYQVDARRCISYLTIENKEAIPVEFRKAMGNRIYGCDDCQLVCPWNRFSENTNETDFAIRHKLDKPALLELFAWDESTFLNKTEGTAIRRIGYRSWLRNICIALGNADPHPNILQALNNKKTNNFDPLIQEHLDWALQEQTDKLTIK